MKTALWIIAICEVVRAAQNAIQLKAIKRDTGARDNAYAEFVKSLKMSDRQFVERSVHNRSEGEMEPMTCDNCKHGDLDWDEDPCDTCGEDHDCWEAANEDK